MPVDLNPPQLYTEEQIELSQLEQGDQITVTVENNIKGKSEFEAKTVQRKAGLETEEPTE